MLTRCVQVWRKADGQVFSLGISWGSIMMFGSYNKFNASVHIDARIVSVVDFLTSLLASIVIFATLDNSAYELACRWRRWPRAARASPSWPTPRDCDAGEEAEAGQSRPRSGRCVLPPESSHQVVFAPDPADTTKTTSHVATCEWVPPVALLTPR
jgi:hypothetical protein